MPGAAGEPVQTWTTAGLIGGRHHRPHFHPAVNLRYRQRNYLYFRKSLFTGKADFLGGPGERSTIRPFT